MEDAIEFLAGNIMKRLEADGNIMKRLEAAGSGHALQIKPNLTRRRKKR